MMVQELLGKADEFAAGYGTVSVAPRRADDALLDPSFGRPTTGVVTTDIRGTLA